MASGNVNIQTGGGGGAVDSVFTRTGNVVAQAGDYNASQITLVTTAFKNLLLSSDNTPQKALDKMDNVFSFRQLALRNIGEMYERTPDAILTTTGVTDLQTAITALTDGQLLEIQSNGTYDPIVIPSGKSFRVRVKYGYNPKITGTRCIGINNGASNVVISGLTIETPNNTGGNNNYQGSAITFNQQNAIIDNVIFHNIMIKNTTTGSAVMLSYHWSVGGDNYANPPQLSELSTRVAFIGCSIYKGCLDGSEGACIAVRGVKNSLFLDNYIDNANDAGRGIQLQGCLDCLVEGNRVYSIGGANAEALKIDQIGTSPFRQSCVFANNYMETAIEGIDADDNVSCFIYRNTCRKCSDEGITLDGGTPEAYGVVIENTCFECGSGILFEVGALGYLANNNSYNNTTNYNMLNGYTPDASNKSIAPSLGLLGIVKFGDATNYSEFESDGTLKFNGNATIFDDLPPIPLLVQRVGGANNPTLAVFQGNIHQLTFAINDYVYFNYEILHGYKEGSNLNLHVHWITNGTDGTDRYVKWEVEYTIANLKESAPFNNLFPANTTVSVEITIPAGTSSLAHILSTIATITGTGLKIGAYICGRFRRIAASSTAPTNDPFGLTVGFHYEQDTVGSRTITAK